MLDPIAPRTYSDPAESRAPLRLYLRREPLGSVTVVTTRVPCDVSLVEDAVELIARHCLAGTMTPSRVRFNLCVALSEALANAIICGNQEDPTTEVDVRAELHPDRIEVYVTDEGGGFDPDGRAGSHRPRRSR